MNAVSEAAKGAIQACLFVDAASERNTSGFVEFMSERVARLFFRRRFWSSGPARGDDDVVPL